MWVRLYEMAVWFRANVIITSADYSVMVFVLYGLLALFFHYSRRMNARLEAAAPKPRRLPRLAQALTDMKATQGQTNVFLFFAKKAERQVVWLLRKTDRLLYDKLKLLPNAQTGQRTNYFLLLLIAWIVPYVKQMVSKGEKSLLLSQLREGLVTHEQAQLGQYALWQWLLFAMLVTFLLVPSVFLLFRKNREYYADVFALFMLLFVALSKLLACWPFGCCFGIEYPWGIYNAHLDTTVFPVQLFEAAVGFLAAFFCILYMLYSKSYRPGRGCSVCLICFMVPRFYFDYYRYRGETYHADEINGLFGMTVGQTLCIAGCLLAIAWWLWLLPLEKKLMDRFWLWIDRRFQKGRAAR